MYVLDANTIIDLFKGRGKVAERVLHTPPAQIIVPTVVLYELEVGVLKSQRPEKNRRHIDELTALGTVVPFEEAEAKAAARIRVDLESQGLVIGPYDILIAATAMAHGNILVTHNTDEFNRVDGLRLESWY